MKHSMKVTLLIKAIYYDKCYEYNDISKSESVQFYFIFDLFVYFQHSHDKKVTFLDTETTNSHESKVFSGGRHVNVPGVLVRPDAMNNFNMQGQGEEKVIFMCIELL